MKKSSLSDFDFAVSTVNRPKNYLHKLISHLRKDVPLRLIVGSPSYDYLERYRGHKNIQVIGIAPEDWDNIKDYNVIHRALWNYWRCLENGVARKDSKGLVIMEDDVLPARGWEKRLDETVEQIESEYGQEFVLALFTSYTGVPKPIAPGAYYTRYPAYSFGGTQAMYYPEPIRAAFAEYIRGEGVESFRMAYDWLLREYLMHTGIPLFATAPCLFEHIGEVTTGLSPRFFQAGYFEKKLRGKKATK